MGNGRGYEFNGGSIFDLNIYFLPRAALFMRLRYFFTLFGLAFK